MDNIDGNAQKTIAHGMSKKKSTRSIGQKLINWEKARPTGTKGASNKILDP